MDQPLPPGLYIVATPIGNLGDMTARAADTLRRVDYILAEDKRVSAKLLAHVGAKAPMTAYHDHSDERLRERILSDLGSKAVALVSDAGTPLISDPGYKLVRAARQAGHAIYTLPGPCAAIAALTLAGLPTDRFLFLGFLPAKAKARADAITEVASIRASLVLYETGPRLGDTLGALNATLGDREVAVVRELTKLHEECVNGTLSELASRYGELAPKGEIVIVVAPPSKPEGASSAQIDSALDEALSRLSPSRAAAEVAELLGLPRKQVYARAIEKLG
ncbi:16S rRNA (cytidine(1402)-2'-O)-methyltransferase [Sphingomonas sp. NSE70-1]|uniref:Ribosomal RNA small subunit methyltransferase I n=1 Tax=Sphingomonas caseinilyticus TaxID=2908205 RepID=A0ABT0RSI8_9SPHN|nr:16S rRNA (cytidine(1402)-2'-O)-methyltransferase [Sphingomonas caseinilyticus]MCL6697967.1 16S rRNA (cytidine(1402)-2'-O)-methyltransferase [Sphingomonas caseinilyticus]